MKTFNLVAVSGLGCLIASALFAHPTHAATLSISGNHRFGANMYSNLDLISGTLPGSGNTSSFIEHRLLIRPDIVVDDRFTIKSEFSLLALGPFAKNTGPENFGAPLDGQLTGQSGSAMVNLRRAYMEWASDWGIFRIGRQPKNWGLGLLYSAGTDPLADYGTTADRVGYQALLGNLGINIGYEKGAEGQLNSDADDIDTYELSLDYSNPESLFDVGLLYARNVRTAGAATTLKSSHDLSIFSQKKIGQFQLGGEFVSISQDTHTAGIGILASVDFMPGAWKLGADFAYASAAADGSFSFHPNYQPFMILFRQTLGPTANPNTVRGGFGGSNAVGAAVAAGDGAGALLTKVNLSYGFDNQKYVLGTDIGYATLARQGTNASKALGLEFDLHFAQKWYDNFKTHYGLAMLFPGSAFGTAPQTAWGFQIRGALTF